MANTGGQFRLTKEESAVMDECRRTSFWYRSVPLMTIATAIMTYRRVNNQMSPKFYGLKIAGGIVGAYIVGKMSYIPECRRLIVQRLPDSNLARGIESKPYDLISDMSQPPEIVSKSTTNSIFGTRTEQEDPQVDIFPPVDIEEKNTTKRYVTYDELRQKNRAEHAAKFAGVKPRTDAPAAPSTAPTPSVDRRTLPPAPIITNETSPSPVQSKRPGVRRNQYGDEVYD